MNEVQTVNIGTLLKDQREKRGHSLQDIAQYTRIRKTYLESIENNQFEDLPGRAYVTGFIRVYARYLGLDSTLLLAQLEETWIDDGIKPLKVTPVAKNLSRPFYTAGWGTFSAGFLGVLIIGSVIYFLLPIFQAREPAESPSNMIVKEQQVPGQGYIEEAGKINMAKEGEVSPAQAVEPTPVVIEETSPEPRLFPPIPPGGLSLRMLALTESSLTIYHDGRKPHYYELHDGLDLTWKIVEQVKVELAEPGVARFWLGGQELDLDGMDAFQLQPAKVPLVKP